LSWSQPGKFHKQKEFFFFRKKECWGGRGERGREKSNDDKSGIRTHARETANLIFSFLLLKSNAFNHSAILSSCIFVINDPQIIIARARTRLCRRRRPT